MHRAAARLLRRAGEVRRDCVIQVAQLAAGLCRRGQRPRLAGQERETVKALRLCALERDRHAVDHVHALIGNGEADRDIAVGRERGIVDRGRNDLDSVCERLGGAEQVCGLPGDGSGTGIGLSVQLIGIADRVGLGFAVCRALHDGADAAAAAGDAGVHVVESGARGERRHLEGRGGDQTAVCGHEPDRADDVILVLARACVVPQDGQLVQALRAFRQREPAVERACGHHVAERLGQAGLRRAVFAEHAQTHVALLRAGERPDAAPAEDELSARRGQLRLFVAAAVSGRADGNGRVLGVFRRDIDERVVNVAAVPVLHGERDRRRAVREQLCVHARDLARAAVVERIGLIAPLRAVIDAAQDAVLRKVEGAFIGLHRAPHRLPPR